MIKSMTAYGRAEVRNGDSVYIAEIKSVNNRYRDVVIRLPRKLHELEKEIRDIVSSRVRRGRLEASIQMNNGSDEGSYGLEVNMPLAESYFEIIRSLSKRFGLDFQLKAETLLQLKDIIILRPEEADLEKERPHVMEVIEKALESCEEMRLREGKAIEGDFLNRLDLIGGLASDLEKRAPVVAEEYSTRLRERIQGMSEDFTIDESRLVQEVAFFAEKSDITEEIVRIKSHLSQFRLFLDLDDALGRRLDFLLQEINREVNTIGSKGSDARISNTVVEMKAELEKLREQVQNVE